MSIFPFVEPITESETVDLTIPKEWAWSFETNDFLSLNNKPYLVEGLEAVKIWACKALNTERFKHLFYSWDYGSEINSLVGSGYSRAAVESEAQRLVQETIKNPYITGVSGFTVEFDNETLSLEFILETIFGETEVSIGAN